MPDDLSLSELSEFLQPSHIAVVGAINRDGTPQMTPTWYVWHKGRIAIYTTEESLKHRNLRRDSRMSLCVIEDPRAVNYATMRGTVEIEYPDSIWGVTKLIVERYVAPEKVDEWMGGLRAENGILLWLAPQRFTIYKMGILTSSG